MAPEYRVFVFSLPRCGSSMMTGIVERLGVDMKHTTEDDETREQAAKQYKKKFGEYIPNEHFYEITNNQFKHWMDIYNTPYSGCKVIIPVGGMRWEAIISQPAKVIMMNRDPAEIRQSQEAFYKKARANYEGKEGEEEKEPWEYAEACLRTHLASTQITLQNRTDLSNTARFYEGSDIKPFDFRIINYRDVLANPKAVVQQVAQFIDADPKFIDYAVSSVEPDKIRFKKEELVEGI